MFKNLLLTNSMGRHFLAYSHPTMPDLALSKKPDSLKLFCYNKLPSNLIKCDKIL